MKIQCLITKINHVRTDNGDVFEVVIQSGFIKDIELSESIINLERNKDGILTKSLLRTKGKWTKKDLLRLYLRLLPSFDHKETGIYLDQKM